MAGGVTLSVSGEVERPLALSLDELAALADDEVVADFHCREGWSRLDQRWRGVRLARLLSLAGVRGSGLHVTVSSGPYAAVLSRDQAEDEQVLLAVSQPGRTDGFPRLVGPSDWDCFLGVKSVDRIEVTREPAPATAETIALERLERIRTEAETTSARLDG